MFHSLHRILQFQSSCLINGDIAEVRKSQGVSHGRVVVVKDGGYLDVTCPDEVVAQARKPSHERYCGIVQIGRHIQTGVLPSIDEKTNSKLLLKLSMNCKPKDVVRTCLLAKTNMTQV